MSQWSAVWLCLTFTADGDRESCCVLEKQKDRRQTWWDMTDNHYTPFSPQFALTNSHKLASPALSCDSYHPRGFHVLALRYANPTYTPQLPLMLTYRAEEHTLCPHIWAHRHPWLANATLTDRGERGCHPSKSECNFFLSKPLTRDRCCIMHHPSNFWSSDNQ